MDPSKRDAKDAEKKRTRGATKMKKLIALRETGVKLPIEMNTREQPIGENSKIMASHIGAIARSSVPIDVKDWRMVSKETKDRMWAEFKVIIY
jgi:hypothetical protein